MHKDEVWESFVYITWVQDNWEINIDWYVPKEWDVFSRIHMWTFPVKILKNYEYVWFSESVESIDFNSLKGNETI